MLQGGPGMGRAAGRGMPAAAPGQAPAVRDLLPSTGKALEQKMSHANRHPGIPGPCAGMPVCTQLPDTLSPDAALPGCLLQTTDAAGAACRVWRDLRGEWAGPRPA